MNIIRWHWHEEIEMFYVIEGEVKILIDDYIGVLKKGQGIFINQNVLHSMHMNNSNNAVFSSVVFHPSFLFGYGRTIMSVKYLTPILVNSNMKYLVFDNGSQDEVYLMECLSTTVSALNNKEIGYELLCKALLCKIWYLLLQVSHTTLPQGAKTKRIANDEYRIKEAILYIEEHYAQDISLNDIANSIHISKSECCRCFKRILHVTPFEYLIKYRIYSATKMMQRHDPNAASIGTLATSIGFSNISYFNKIFKKYLGFTPTEYKKKYRMFVPTDENFMDITILPK